MALRAAVEEAAGDVRRLEAMGQAGRRLVEERFSWSRVADDFLRLCTDLLANQPDTVQRGRQWR
jgi:glycosyltransferase involved in cell wall biosynthesis